MSVRLCPVATLCSALAVLLLSCSSGAAAVDSSRSTATSPGTEHALELEAVEVIAEVTGPGLWALRRDGRVVWVLGVQSPLPKRFRWESPELDARLAEASLLIAPPGFDLKGVNRFNAVFLLPSLIRARRDPEGLTLAERVPPEQHERWLALKQKYFPRKRGTEKWRPLIAALELYSEAMEDVGLSYRRQVWDAVERKARRQRIEIARPELVIEAGRPRELIRSFADNTLDDLDCFERTLDRLESDLVDMAERAEAWAVGDVAALRTLPFRDQAQACRDAFLKAQFAEDRGLDEIPQRLRALWIESVESALAEHRSSVAVLDIALLLDPELGMFEALRARGIEVVEPDAGDALDEAASAELSATLP
jgi:hypothetical protein